MALFCLGINHKTAPVAIRERMSFTPEQLAPALTTLTSLAGIEEAALLSTCNRTEIYCNLVPSSHQTVADWLAQERAAEDPGVRERFYSYRDAAAIRHLLRVASGLDSMVLGEPQILGQIKQAYRLACAAGAVGPGLHRVFQRTFSAAKQIRTDTRIGESPVSVAFAAATLARRIFASFDTLTALLVGAGETIELAARYLYGHGMGRMIIANRTAARARVLAQPYKAFAIGLDEIDAHLFEADVVISATASPNALLKRPAVEAALSHRKHRPVLMVDIAVPRDIDANVADLEDVYLYTIDDLRQVIEEGMRSRRAAAHQAEEIIKAQVMHLTEALSALDAVPTIRELRQTAERTRQTTLHRAERMLAAGRPPEEALAYLANTLTNRLLHAPTAHLRQASQEGRAELIIAARNLYGIEE
jgi:glutamyl-tRNA reductase